MLEERIKKDIKFRQRCSVYGLDWSQFEILHVDKENYIIALNNPNEDIYVLFDKNYNTICMEKCDYINDREDLENFINSRYVMYNNLPCVFNYRKNFGYPFQDFTLKQIIDLSNRIEIMETNDGQVLSTRVNGYWYDRDKYENKEYFQLLSYIKFLGEEIKEYFKLNYHMQTMGFDVPDIYEYVRTLINKINNSVDLNIKNNKINCPNDILKLIGKNPRELKMNEILYDINNLLISKKDLSIIAKALLEVLNVSDEDLKINGEDYIQKLVAKNISNLGLDTQKKSKVNSYRKM